MEQEIQQPKGPCYADLKGKIALVTGGGTGIGRGICMRLADEGMHVILCGRTKETLDETTQLVEATGGSATPIVSDLSKEEDVDSLFTQIKDKFGTLDLLVHNAAQKLSGTLMRTSAEAWRSVFDSNIHSSFYLTKQCTEIMVPNQAGTIVFISTIGAQRAHYNMMAYDCSKGAMETLIRTTAIELARYNIRVNGVAPGATAIRGFAFSDPVPAEKLAQPHIPLGRSGTPEEMAAAVAFLASNQSAYIIGQTIVVDGGALAQLSPLSARF